MTIECGGVVAKDGQHRKFVHHLSTEDRLEIKLVGFRDGGLAHYSKYFKRWPLDSLIGSGTVSVEAGEEDDLWGLVVRGSMENTTEEREKERLAIIEKNRNWTPPF